MRVQKFLIGIIFITVILSVMASEVWALELTDTVNDYGNIFSMQEEYALRNIIEEVERTTTVEIAIVSVSSLEGQTIENYAVDLFRENSIGKKDNNNGLLILLAMEERQYRIETGYGLEGTLPSVIAYRIGTQVMEPYFSDGEYAEGVYNGILEMNYYIQKDPDVVSKYQTKKGVLGIPVGVWILMIILIFVILGALGSRMKRASDMSGVGSTIAGGATYGFGGYSHHSTHGFSGFGGGLSGGGGYSGRF